MRKEFKILSQVQLYMIMKFSTSIMTSLFKEHWNIHHRKQNLSEWCNEARLVSFEQKMLDGMDYLLSQSSKVLTSVFLPAQSPLGLHFGKSCRVIAHISDLFFFSEGQDHQQSWAAWCLDITQSVKWFVLVRIRLLPLLVHSTNNDPFLVSPFHCNILIHPPRGHL